MTVFEAVYETGSITRAAERLALSQSATSHALSRLRDACRDDLFVRVGQGIVPTPVAQRIYPDIRRALDGLRQSISEARGFDPETSKRHFHLGIPHPMGPLWAVALREAVRKIAPGIVLDFDTRTLPLEAADRMRMGDLDMCVDFFEAEGSRFVNRKLFDDGVVFIARGGHPRATPDMDIDALRREQFVRVHRRSVIATEPIRAARQTLADLDLDWVLSISEFLEVPYLVMKTDLMGFIPRSMIRPDHNVAGLQVIEAPLASVRVPIYTVWHETRRADNGHRWLRDLTSKVVLEAAGQPHTKG